MNILKTAKIKINPHFFIIFMRKTECRTIFLKLLKMHAIIIKKVDKNVRISVYIVCATSSIA